MTPLHWPFKSIHQYNVPCCQHGNICNTCSLANSLSTISVYLTRNFTISNCSCQKSKLYKYQLHAPRTLYQLSLCIRLVADQGDVTKSSMPLNCDVCIYMYMYMYVCILYISFNWIWYGT